MKIIKVKYSEEYCIHCGKWFYKITNNCPDSYMHKELGIKCCHWEDVPLPLTCSAVERKRRKRLEEQIKKQKN